LRTCGGYRDLVERDARALLRNGLRRHEPDGGDEKELAVTHELEVFRMFVATKHW
jgi:hypothetical protein